MAEENLIVAQLEKRFYISTHTGSTVYQKIFINKEFKGRYLYRATLSALLFSFYIMEERPVINVKPEGDLKPHSDTPDCECNPTVEEFEGHTLIIHNSFDGREAVEEANRLLGIEEEKISGNIEDYYHPNIDEFCVGFEYVIGRYVDDDIERGEVTLEDMNKCVFHPGDFDKFDIEYDPDGYKMIFVPKIFMVERLNHGNIMELGFEPLLSDDIMITYWHPELKLNLDMLLQENYNICIAKEGNEFKDLLFKGWVDNKFQLSKIIESVIEARDEEM